MDTMHKQLSGLSVGSSTVRSSFDAPTGLLVHPEYLVTECQSFIFKIFKKEYELDHVFAMLGVTDVQCPVFMTETMSNPNACRHVSSELLFETYNIPHVAYGVDSICSYYENMDGYMDAGIVVESGHLSTYVIPIMDGRWVHEQTRRLPMGGVHTCDFMQKSLLLKYPDFTQKITPAQISEMVIENCHVATNYKEELSRLADFDRLALEDRVVNIEHPAAMEVDEEDILVSERKKQLQKERMQAYVVKTRNDKLVVREKQLRELLDLQEEITTAVDSVRLLKSFGYKSEDDLEVGVQVLHSSIESLKNKISGLPEPEVVKETPIFPLVNIPDADLNEEQLKEKRRQRLMKAGYDAREKIRIAKEAAREEEEIANKLEEVRRLKDPQGWLDEMNGRRLQLIEQMKQRKKTTEEGGRGKSNLRMKTISNMAVEDDLTKSGAKRKRKTDDKNTADTFGADDEDWAVYKDIAVGGDPVLDADDEDAARLEHIEMQLMEHDPDFKTVEELELLKRQNHLYDRMQYGAKGYVDEDDYDGQYDVHLNVERIRVPEILFQPSIIGADKAGLTEILLTALSQFTSSQKDRMVQNVILTGGHTQFPGFEERLTYDIRMNRPFESKFNVRRARSAQLDAWRGASKWASKCIESKQLMNKHFISRSDYNEFGSEYLREHPLSNVYFK